ncbi:MAG: transporter substrate-binding domain-containing protein [Acidimicrobiales bacterium]|jgi:ABC-type amino acid transport substrate-binding protein|nr:transporter substrate-binding domain-containing protein [Acidimicrobiales bacterium]
MHEQELRVRVGYQEDFSPFAALGASGPEGLAVNILSSAFEQLGVETVWMPLSLEQQIPALLQNSVDVLACLGVTEERKSQLVFGEPIILTGGALFRLVEGPDTDDSIVTPAGGPLVVTARESFPNSSVIAVDGYPEALRLVSQGNADAAALNVHVGHQIAERDFPQEFAHPDPVFKEIFLAPAWPPKHDDHLREVLNDVVTVEGLSQFGTQLGTAQGDDKPKRENVDARKEGDYVD